MLESKKTSFDLDISSRSVSVDLKLSGLFNVYNSLGAAAAAAACGCALATIKQGLEAVESVPGRFELVDCGQSFSVIVDYAHTPDGLEKLLASARQITKGRLITVFGCGGDRDVLKRPLMGQVAGNLSDFSIITSDNPRSEDPEAIVVQIQKGLRGITSDYAIEVDRKNAIYKGLAMAKEHDCVLIAGKGHETYQELKDLTIEFDDRQVAKSALKELAKCSP